MQLASSVSSRPHKLETDSFFELQQLFAIQSVEIIPSEHDSYLLQDSRDPSPAGEQVLRKIKIEWYGN